MIKRIHYYIFILQIDRFETSDFKSWYKVKLYCIHLTYSRWSLCTECIVANAIILFRRICFLEGGSWSNTPIWRPIWQLKPESEIQVRERREREREHLFSPLRWESSCSCCFVFSRSIKCTSLSEQYASYRSINCSQYIDNKASFYWMKKFKKFSFNFDVFFEYP